MRTIKTDKIPVPKGHYSPVVEHAGLIYISGQIPQDPSNSAVPATIKDQTELVLSKIDMLLTEAGSSREKVIQVRIYLSDISYWDEVNAVYAGFFGEHRPARCIVPVGKLHYGCLIEAEAVAYI